MRILLNKDEVDKLMKKLYISILLVAVMVIAAACGSNDNGSNENEAAGTVTVEHDMGTTEVKKNPDNVVVFDFGSLDSLQKLGLQDVVSGVAQAGVIPTYLEEFSSDEYENIGSLKEPDFEKIAEINPDLIITSARQGEVYEQLAEIADTIQLEVDPTRYMDSFRENVGILGEIFEKETEVEAALADLDEVIESVQATTEVSDKNALIILANDDKISAYGPDSRFGIIHDVFGVPAVDDGIEVARHGMNVSFEYVVEEDPDILYVVDRGAVVGGDSSAQQIVENKLTKRTKAYKNDNIVYLDPEYWYLSGGGLQSVQAMADEITDSLE